MQCIADYTPPSAADLAHLKKSLGLTSPQMAGLTGLAQGAQWRKYTGGDSPRPLGMQMHFYMAALLVLDDAALHLVLDKMREQGAQVQAGPLPGGGFKDKEIKK